MASSSACGLLLSLSLLMTRPVMAQNPSVAQVSVADGETFIDPTRLANQTSAKYTATTQDTPPETGLSTPNSGGDADDEDVPPVGGTRCQGYYDVMGQWDPPFNCNAGVFLYCCGTCFYRFCCQFRQQRLDQSICNNYDTPIWANTGKPVATITEGGTDQDRDRTHLIVYIICGVVAIMVLVGIFTKLGLEKSRGGSGGVAQAAQADLNTRTLTELMKQQSSGGEGSTIHNSPSRSDTANGTSARILRSRSEQYHLNNSPFGQGLPHTLSNHSAGGLNKYTSLKAVADGASHRYYKSYPLMDFSRYQPVATPPDPSSSLPVAPPTHLDHALLSGSAFRAWEPNARHVQRQTSAPGHGSAHPHPHNPNRRHTYSTRRQGSSEDLPLFSQPYGGLQGASAQGHAHSPHPQPLYSRPKSFSTHSTTEVTV